MNNEYRFNIGYIVRVKSYMTIGDDEYPGFVSEMEQYKSNEYVIGEVVSDKVYGLKRTDGVVDRDLERFFWLYKWLEPVIRRDSIEELL